MSSASQPRSISSADILQNSSPQQAKRYEKIYVEPFYVISKDFVNTAEKIATFKISGSMRDVYTVDLFRNGKTSCSCIDSSIHCRKHGCVCKHVCFVAYRVFRLADASIVRDLAFSPANVAAVVDKLAADMFDASLFTRAEEEKDDEEEGGGCARGCCFACYRKPAPEDECPVCYCVLLDGEKKKNDRQRELLGCPSCGNAIHRECIERWIANAPMPTCVYCRSTVWKNLDF